MSNTHTIPLGRAVNIPHDSAVTGEGKGPFTRVSTLLSTEDHRVASSVTQVISVTTQGGEVIKYKFTRSTKPCQCGADHSVSLY